jgi:hypothetical protein
VLRCGKCGKPFTPFKAHVCNGRRTGRTALKPAVSVTSPCPKCGKQRSNPFTHTCQVRTDFKARKHAADRQAATAKRRAAAAARRQAQAAKRRAAAERRKAREKAAAAARRARAAERRKAAADKRRAAAGERRKTAAALRKGTPVRTRSHTGHDYRTCADARCERSMCLVWKEALREGYEAGYETGYHKGHAAGYATGYDAGIADCPRKHAE